VVLGDPEADEPERLCMLGVGGGRVQRVTGGLALTDHGEIEHGQRGADIHPGSNVTAAQGDSPQTAVLAPDRTAAWGS
jgi:hypothetical protein